MLGWSNINAVEKHALLAHLALLKSKIENDEETVLIPETHRQPKLNYQIGDLVRLDIHARDERNVFYVNHGSAMYRNTLVWNPDDLYLVLDLMMLAYTIDQPSYDSQKDYKFWRYVSSNHDIMFITAEVLNVSNIVRTKGTSSFAEGNKVFSFPANALQLAHSHLADDYPINSLLTHDSERIRDGGVEINRRREFGTPIATSLRDIVYDSLPRDRDSLEF